MNYLKLNIVMRFPGNYSGEATPVPIPNTAVKLSSADGTALTCGRVGSCQELYYLLEEDFVIYRVFLLLASPTVGVGSQP